MHFECWLHDDESAIGFVIDDRDARMNPVSHNANKVYSISETSLNRMPLDPFT
jgi:hypothetical protein